jgi:hypothetical protein
MRKYSYNPQYVLLLGIPYLNRIVEIVLLERLTRDLRVTLLQIALVYVVLSRKTISCGISLIVPVNCPTSLSCMPQ